eukprot:6189550-Pleurochrysis_carterae.AAC.2
MPSITTAPSSSRCSWLTLQEFFCWAGMTASRRTCDGGGEATTAESTFILAASRFVAVDAAGGLVKGECMRVAGSKISDVVRAGCLWDKEQKISDNEHDGAGRHHHLQSMIQEGRAKCEDYVKLAAVSVPDERTVVACTVGAGSRQGEATRTLHDERDGA